MNILTLLVAAIAVAVFAPRLASADEVKLASRPGQRASLVELYTSEGCSSCPPAEAWLSRLAASPQLWTEIVPVAFHVDYWDNLGWRDRFASAAWTERQRAYASAWGNGSVYTPGVVLDGAEWQQWSGWRAGAPLPPPKSAAAPGELSAVATDARAVALTYKPAERSGAPRSAFVALLGFDLRSDVKAGENRGRALRHDFVVLDLQTKLLSSGAAEHASFTLPPRTGDTQLALAAWVEEAGRPGVEQAAGAWLTRPAAAAAH